MKQLRFFNQVNSELKIVENELFKFIRTDFPLLRESSIHLLEAGGKRLRPAFALLAGKFYGSSRDKLLLVAMALELIHMATLVHDDVVDASKTRRGRPTVKAQWGNIISVRTGDYLLAKSLELIAEINHPDVSRILAKVSTEMCKGEIQQIKALFDTRQSLKQYYYRIKRKTALLIQASCLTGGIVSGAPKKQIWSLGAYGHSLGIAFQIVDDILDITAEATELGKPIGGDLRQGVMTLPMIIALKLSPQREKLHILLSKENKTESEVGLAISLIREAVVINEAKCWVNLYVNKAKGYLENLPKVPARKALEELAEFVRIRKF
jgi:heptaprenyl diphosphate synthase